LDWGAEFCVISDIFGFSIAQIAELTLPQFLRYSRYANEQKLFRLDIRTVNDYISNLFGQSKPEDPYAEKSKAIATVSECKTDFNDKINNVFNIRDARNSLRRKTGEEEFNMNDIIKEINELNKSDKYRFVEPKQKPKTKKR